MQLHQENLSDQNVSDEIIKWLEEIMNAWPNSCRRALLAVVPQFATETLLQMLSQRDLSSFWEKYWSIDIVTRTHDNQKEIDPRDYSPFVDFLPFAKEWDVARRRKLLKRIIPL
jgi:hypothetical protein